MTWDIGQEGAELLLLTEYGHQITARGGTQTQMARPSHQIKLNKVYINNSPINQYTTTLQLAKSSYLFNELSNTWQSVLTLM